MPSGGITKPFTSFEDQISLLESRGLKIPDKASALRVLMIVNYYRLSAYSLTLRKDDKFYPGTTFEQIWELYKFDADFRNIILKYCPYIEHSFRAHISHHHSEKYGPLGYLNNQYFENEEFHARFLSKLFKEIEYSDDVFIKHHKHDLSGVYPFWVAIEVTSFDVLSKLYKNLLSSDRTYISKTYYDVSREYVENWLQVIVVARNISAHGGRFYNRKIRIPIKLDAVMRGKFDERSPFAAVYAINMLLPYNSIRFDFLCELENLFHRYPFANLRWMGFPENWSDILLDQALTETL